MGYALRARAPSLTSLNLTVLIRWWSVIHRAPCLLCIRDVTQHTPARPSSRTEQSISPACVSRLSAARPQRWGTLSYGSASLPPLTPLSPLIPPGLVGIVLYIFMSGELFSFSFENEDKLLSVIHGELGMNLHFLYSQSHLHVCSFSVVPLLPKGNWTVYFCLCLKSVGGVIKFPKTPFPQLHTLKEKVLVFFFPRFCFTSLPLAGQ